MDYKKLAFDLIKCLPMPGKVRQQNMGSDLCSEGHVLLLIHHQRDILPKEIAETLRVSSARIATILTKLSENKLITREIDEDDRRQIKIVLTKLGEKEAERQKDKVLEQISMYLEKLGEHDAKEYVRIMGRLAEIKNNNDMQD